jgi:RHS repeat-associated protein
LIASTNGTTSGAYAYDGVGTRVKKCVPNCSTPTTTTVYIFVGGKVLAEYDNGASVTSPSREYIYSGGTFIAKFIGTTATYYHQDHISNRVITNTSATSIESLGHLPYGETWYDTGSEKWKFTSYERDAESGNDYAMARYHINRLGRFSSPDLLSGSTSDPQSLNHYVYGSNDPINAMDPTGKDTEFEVCGPGYDGSTESEAENCTPLNSEDWSDQFGGGGDTGNGSSDGGTSAPADTTASEAAFATPGGSGFGVVGGIPGMSETMTTQQNTYVAWINQIGTDDIDDAKKRGDDVLSTGTTKTAFPPDPMGNIASGANPTTPTWDNNKQGGALPPASIDEIGPNGAFNVWIDNCFSVCAAGGNWLQGLLSKNPNNPLSGPVKATSPKYTCSIQSQMGSIATYTCTTANGIVGQLTATLAQVQKGCNGVSALPLVINVTGDLIGSFTVSACSQ